MDKFEALMAPTKWNKHCLRTNVAQPEQIEHQGKVKVAKIYNAARGPRTTG